MGIAHQRLSRVTRINLGHHSQRDKFRVRHKQPLIFKLEPAFQIDSFTKTNASNRSL